MIYIIITVAMTPLYVFFCSILFSKKDNMDKLIVRKLQIYKSIRYILQYLKGCVFFLFFFFFLKK